MNYETASGRQREIAGKAARRLEALFRQYAGQGEGGWARAIAAAFQIVRRAQTESARVGRTYYDNERKRHLGETRPVELAELRRTSFVKALEPAKAAYIRPGADAGEAHALTLRATRLVEDGWRRTVIEAVESEPDLQDYHKPGQDDDSPAWPQLDPDNVRYVRWARVATGRETCAFCLTLISRGPVYRSRESAGGDRQFHPGCDCRVVPVYNMRNWKGREAHKRAEAVWEKYSRKVRENPELLVPGNGNQRKKGSRKWTLNEAIIAAIRRDIERGVLKMEEFAVAA